ncbi:toxin glutamine deamidase domain-containing protein [Paractinoplanes durhamensis]|uniref:toxin glutamine deamidase domain-containing protein n=1 Tax=Paractinoplanes durhamensis TaxID=113563 RepID=UPI003630843F
MLSLFSTYLHGRPRVAAPRTFDAYAAGDPNRPVGGEWHGLRRIELATGTTFQNLCPFLGGAAPTWPGPPSTPRCGISPTTCTIRATARSPSS